MTHPSNAGLRPSQIAIDTIKKWEGFRANAYRDFGGVWTIGYGSINRPELGIHVSSGDTISEARATELMMIELNDFLREVLRLVRVQLDQGQLDGLLIFTYNLGATNLAKSTLLALLNMGDFEGAAREFRKWNKARDRKTGKRVVLRGLANRRADEEAIFRGMNKPLQPPPENPTRVTRDQVITPDVLARPAAPKPVPAPSTPAPAPEGKQGLLAAIGALLVSMYVALESKAQAIIASPYALPMAAFVVGLALGYVLRNLVRPR